MKKYLSLLVFVTSLVLSVNAQSTDQAILSPTTEENRLEATIICLDAIDAPTKYNAFAKQFINDISFPKKEASPSENEYKSQISEWLISNPSKVDEILIERKKAHDILYGPRPY